MEKEPTNAKIKANVGNFVLFLYQSRKKDLIPIVLSLYFSYGADEGI